MVGVPLSLELSLEATKNDGGAFKPFTQQGRGAGTCTIAPGAVVSEGCQLLQHNCSLTVRRWLAANVGPSREAASSGVRKYLPSVEVGFGSHASRYSRSKLAVIIEPRPLSHLSPLLLHTIQVVPPDWRFMLVGTDESVRHVNTSLGIRTHVASGKLEYRKMLLSANEISVHQKETASADVSEITNRVLTDTNFYGSVIGPAESLFIFNSNSVLCANSNYTLDDWLQYDWVTAPGYVQRYPQ